MKRYLWFVFAVVMAGAVIAYRNLPSGLNDFSHWLAGGKEITVKVVQAKKGPITHVVTGNAELRPVKEVEVEARIAGYLEEIRFKVGDSVAAGQLVATVRSKELLQRVGKTEAALRTAEADLRESESQLGDAEKQLERARELHRSDLIAGRDLATAEAAAATARAQRELALAHVAQQQATLEQSRYLLGFSQLTAPISGVVTRRLAEPGSSINRSEPILTIADLDPLKVMIELPERDRDLVHEGMAAQVRVDAIPGRIFEGKIVASFSGTEAADPASGAEVQLSNGDRLLKPGMDASVSLVLGKRWDAIVLPKPALVEIDGQSYVYTVVNGKVERKSVTKGWEQEGIVEITRGINAGEWVVVSGQDALKPNSRVTMSENGSNAAEELP